MKVWVTLGYFDDQGDGRIVELDLDSGQIREVLHFQPDEAQRVPGKGFTGAAWTGARGSSDLLICGANAVHRFEPQTMRHLGYIALPSFNDIHAAAVLDDRVYVVNTGLDGVDVLDLEGRFLGTHSFESSWLLAERFNGATIARDNWAKLRERGWSRRSDKLSCETRLGDYYDLVADKRFGQRKVRDYVHPNHICFYRGRPLVNCLALDAVVDLLSWQPIVRTSGPAHDGQIIDDELWLTMTSGFIERHTLAPTARLIERIDVSELSNTYGWCRGLLVTEQLLIAGFTEIRTDPRYPWRDGSFANTSTSVVAIDRKTRELVRRFDLSDPQRHSKMYCILEVA